MTDNLREVLEAVADGRLTERQALPLLRALTTPGAPANPEAPAVPGAPAVPEDSPAEEDTYPLSRGQAALWAIQQSAPGTTAYNLPLALRLRPDADPRHLQGALSAAVRRHPSLRISVRPAPRLRTTLMRESRATSSAASPVTTVLISRSAAPSAVCEA